MAHIVKGRRWTSSVPYYIRNGVDPGLRGLINDAIALIEDSPFRFVNRTNQPDYIRFRQWNEDYSRSDEVGRDGGRQDIRLSKGASLATVVHEIGHALGLYHEHERRDRSNYIEIVDSHIDPEHRDQFEKLSADDSKHFGDYDQDSLMHYERDNYGLYNWSEGWTSLAFHQIDRAPPLLIVLKKDDGHIHVHEMDPDARVGRRLQKKNWTSGYTSLVPFRVLQPGGAARHFVLMLKEDGGGVRIHELGGGGIGARVQKINWSDGWTSVDTYEAAGKTFLLMLKRDGGEIHIHQMQANGRVGDRTFTDNWSDGWTIAKTFFVRQTSGSVRNYLFLLKKGNGTARVHHMRNNGKVGAEVKSYDWRDGWTNVAFYERDSRTYMVLLNSAKGWFHLHHMRMDGRVGRRTGTYNWTSGYTNLDVIRPRGRVPYMFVLKSGHGGIGHIHELDRGTIEDQVRPFSIRTRNGQPSGDDGRLPADLLTLTDRAALAELAPDPPPAGPRRPIRGRVRGK